MNGFDKLVEQIIIERNKTVDNLILGEIQEIATENGFDKKIIINEKAVVSAFKKQIPIAVEVVSRGGYAPDYYCPICKKQQKDSHKNKTKGCYCERCGQALDWSDTDGR